jgi:hypothetical protein
MIIDDNNVVIGINFAGNSDDNNQYYSYDNYGLLLNTRNSFFGKENNYEVFTD